MLRRILTVPNSILNTPASAVSLFDRRLKGLADDMIETMHYASGVGLAAPQVGQSLCLIVVEYNSARDDSPRGPSIPLTILVNPEIVHFSIDYKIQLEGCLSIPGVELPIKRSQRIKIVGQNLSGDRVKINATGFSARIFQHEVDHVNGILITDRAKPHRRSPNL